MVEQFRKGTVLRNMDARYNGDEIMVTGIDYKIAGDPMSGVASVSYHTGARKAKISRHRIFTDGKDRSFGYNVVRF